MTAPISPSDCARRQQPELDAIALFHSELSLVETVANQLNHSCAGMLDRRDLLNAGREGLFQAARRYDSTRRVSFRWYALSRVRGAMLDRVRATCLRRRARAYPNPNVAAEADADTGVEADVDEDGGDAAFDSTPSTPTLRARSLPLGLSHALLTYRDAPDASPESLVASAEAMARVRAAIASFPPQDRTIILRHYFDNDDFRSIARDLQLDPSWVSRIHARALKRLVKRLRPWL
jgi:RNA polymerase sigma factor FliA